MVRRHIRKPRAAGAKLRDGKKHSEKHEETAVTLSMKTTPIVHYAGIQSDYTHKHTERCLMHYNRNNARRTLLVSTSSIDF